MHIEKIIMCWWYWSEELEVKDASCVGAYQEKKSSIMCWWKSSEASSCVDEDQVKNSSCVDEQSSQEPGLEVNMCVIKLQEDAQDKGMTS